MGRKFQRNIATDVLSSTTVKLIFVMREMFTGFILRVVARVFLFENMGFLKLVLRFPRGSLSQCLCVHHIRMIKSSKGHNSTPGGCCSAV